MNTIITYGIIFIILLALELCYFKVADKFNIIDKPNERSSHSTIVLRGGGVIFTFAAWIWFAFYANQGGVENWPFIVGLSLVALVSFIDDIHSLPDSVRLIAQFVAMGLMFWNIGLFEGFESSNGLISGIILPALFVMIAFIVCVGATNIINFMDGINGITGAYAMASLIPLYLLNDSSSADGSLIMTMILATLVFCIFNFRPRGKAKCFAGDVGSIGVAFILLYCIGKVIIHSTTSTELSNQSSGQVPDVTYLVFLVLYGLDGVITICHRIMLHENLGEAHRKHSYQLMANELKMSHVTVSLIYAITQLTINLVFIYFVPNNVAAHWLYLIGVLIIFGTAFLLFRKKYYHLHAEYLESLKK